MSDTSATSISDSQLPNRRSRTLEKDATSEARAKQIHPKRSRPKSSDTSDTSVHDSPPPEKHRLLGGDGKSKLNNPTRSHPKSPDTSDTSIVDDSPPTKRAYVRKTKPPSISRPKSIKRSQLLAALRTLESDLKNGPPNVDPLQDEFPKKDRLAVFRRCCSLDLSSRTDSWSVQCFTSKARLLTYSLTNSVVRHDWSTAAQCVQLMVDMARCSRFVYRTLLLVLLNHPHSTSETICNFLTRVLNLRTRSDQLTFLRQAFLLPDDIEEFTLQEKIMSTKLQDETSSEDSGMTSSEDENGTTSSESSEYDE